MIYTLLRAKANIEATLGFEIQAVSNSPRNEVPGTRRVDFTQEPTQAQRELANAIADAHNKLTLSATAETIPANDTTTSIITCNDTGIAGDAEINYEVINSDGNIDFSGTVPVVAGVATYNFKTPIEDKYIIRMFRLGEGNYEDGYVEVTANG